MADDAVRIGNTVAWLPKTEQDIRRIDRCLENDPPDREDANPLLLWGHAPPWLEAVALEGYRSGALSRGQVGRLLGLNFWETEAFLKVKQAYLPYADSELAQDRASLDSALGA